MSKKNVILGLVAVAAIAGAAVLLGTDKGKKLRKKLSKKGTETVDHFKNKMNRYAETNG